MAVSVVENASDLRKLPLRALVAYAARCARRVQAQYLLPSEQPDAAACLAAIEAALRFAEQVAAGNPIASEVAAQVAEATVGAMLAVNGEESGNSAAAYAANAAYAAVDAAAAVLEALADPDAAEHSDKVVDAATIAFDAASAICADVVRPATLDWEMLHRMHLGKFPAVGEPVNPAETGILGPLFRRAAAKTKSSATGSGRPAAVQPNSPEESKPAGVADPAAEQMLELAARLREKEGELRALQKRIDEDQAAIEADRAALDAVNKELEARRTEIEREAARFELDRARGVADEKAAEAAGHLIERQQELERNERQLQEDRARLAAERETFLADIAQLQTDRAELEKQRAAAQQLNAERASIEVDIRARRQSLEEEADRLQSAQENFNAERTAVEERSAHLIERETNLRERQAKLDEERATIAQKAEESEKAAVELHETAERMRQERQQLRSLQDELRARREELLNDDRKLQADRLEFQQEASDTRRKGEETAVAAEELGRRQRDIDIRSRELESRQAEFSERRAQIEAGLLSLKTREETLAGERREFERLRLVAEEQGRQLDQQAAELTIHANQNELEAIQIQTQRDELQLIHDDVRDQRAALESARQHLEHDRQKARETAKEVERDRRKYAELRTQYESDQRALKIARDELESAGTELRQQTEKFDAARVVFMEEKSQVAKKEADIHKALKQLRDERKRLQPEEDSVKSWSLQQTPRETVADLQILLSRLHDERHRLKIEREQLAGVFALISGGRTVGSPARGARNGDRTRPQGSGESGPKIEGARLRMILEPGSASSADLAEMFFELSALDRQLGGPGVEFKVTECRTWSHTAIKPGPSGASAKVVKAAGDERSFVEIYAIPVTPTDPELKFSATHWDRFTASLFMVLRLDAGQANYFELAEIAPREHGSHGLAADAAARAERRPIKAADNRLNDLPAEMSIDAVNRQLQKIEELRRKLEREESLVLELAPILETAMKESETQLQEALPLPSRWHRVAAIVGAAASAMILITALILFLRKG